MIESMTKGWFIGIVLCVFTLLSPVSAFGDIQFSYSGNLVVTYVSESAGYNNEFGIETPYHLSLGFTKGNEAAAGGTPYKNIGRCSAHEPVILYINSPTEGGGVTYFSNQSSGDGLDHAIVTTLGDGSFTVGFEDIFGPRQNPSFPGDGDYDDVVLNVACVRLAAPPMEGESVQDFPVIALPAGFICGIIGSALYIRRTREQ
jgi:hypothetical protein